MNLEAHAFASEGLLCPTWTCSFSCQLNFKCDYDHQIDVLQRWFFMADEVSDWGLKSFLLFLCFA